MVSENIVLIVYLCSIYVENIDMNAAKIDEQSYVFWNKLSLLVLELYSF